MKYVVKLSYFYNTSYTAVYVDKSYLDSWMLHYIFFTTPD